MEQNYMRNKPVEIKVVTNDGTAFMTDADFAANHPINSNLSWTWSCGDWPWNHKYQSVKSGSAFTPEKVIWNNPYTTVLWSDGTKTIVKATENEPFNPELGFAYALMRKVFGSRTAYQKMLENVGYREYTKEEKKAYREAKKNKKSAE